MSMRRRGFTLLEVSVASGMTVLMAGVLASSWIYLSRPTINLIACGQLFQEMNLSVAAVARDFGGTLSDYQDSASYLGKKKDGRPTAYELSNGGAGLRLTYTGESSDTNDSLPPTTTVTIEYTVDAVHHTLVRTKQVGALSTSFVVANSVDSIQVTSQASNSLRIDLTFKCFNYAHAAGSDPLSRTCTLIVKTTP
jgi:hypothetical protein